LRWLAGRGRRALASPPASNEIVFPSLTPGQRHALQERYGIDPDESFNRWLAELRAGRRPAEVRFSPPPPPPTLSSIEDLIVRHE
jgi:hypothetical protein